MSKQKQERGAPQTRGQDGNWRSPLGAEAFSRLALAGSSAVFVVTVVAWGAAKAACNYHPLQPASFTPAELSERTSTAKGTALEFHHRLVTADFDAAKALARDAGARLVQRAASNCDPCDALRAQRQGTVTRAEIWQASDAGVTATALSVGPPGLHDEATYRLVERDGQWWVVRRLAD